MMIGSLHEAGKKIQTPSLWREYYLKANSKFKPRRNDNRRGNIGGVHENHFATVIIEEDHRCYINGISLELKPCGELGWHRRL